MIDPNESAIVNDVLCPRLRRELVAKHVEIGAPRAEAEEIVDIAFHAARKGYNSLIETALVSDSSASVVALSAQLLTVILQATTETLRVVLAECGAATGSAPFVVGPSEES